MEKLSYEMTGLSETRFLTNSRLFDKPVQLVQKRLLHEAGDVVGPGPDVVDHMMNKHHQKMHFLTQICVF